MTRAAPSVELAEIGALACLYRSDTGALSILTPAARAAWLDRNEAHDAGDASLLARWREQGFLDAKVRGETSAEPPLEVASKPPILDRCYAIGSGRACRLTVDCEPLAQLLGAVLRPLESEGIAAQSSILVTETADGIAVLVGGIRCFSGAPASARSEALRQLLLALVGWDEVGALLHASTVAGPGGAMALLGQSGSGKSTLAAELVGDGFAYVADDLSALDRRANAIHPFPLGLSVKSGSLEAVARRFPELRDVVELTTRRLRVRYLDLKARAVPPGQPVPLAALVFPLFDAGTTMLEAERLRPEAALHLAIDSGSVPDGTRRSIQPLARLCNEVPAWQLIYGDVGAASAWVRARLAGSP